ncbi:UbiA family prenyltransferase [Aspergillus stella-maris]|uniref:UbiA family prenyltransferase n=1 Tax=Aspergillus stella-maris TaxID=1810926 RepID=UPI003CCD9207
MSTEERPRCHAHLANSQNVNTPFESSQALFFEETHFTSQPSSPWHPLSLAKTLYLFTISDLFTFIVPNTTFGTSAALGGISMPATNLHPTPDRLAILTKLPRIILWNWLNLLIFNLANQRNPPSVLEDSLNKPWRPIPSARITAAQATRLLLLSLPVVLVCTYTLGAAEETIILFTLTWMYNDLGGGDSNFVMRNILLAVAIGLYNLASLRIASNCALADVSTPAWKWLGITSTVIATTIQMQDMKDQKGDSAKGRRTAPLVLGDCVACWSIALPVVAWSVVCPAFWGVGLLGYFLPLGIGGGIVYRDLVCRGVREDKWTWWLWCFWMGVLWVIPVFSGSGDGLLLEFR